MTINPSLPVQPENRIDAWLAGLLIEGPLAVREIETAAKTAAVSMRTIERAKKRLDIKAVKVDKVWYWGPPPVQNDIGIVAEETIDPTVQVAPEPGPRSGPAPWPAAMVRARPGYQVIHRGPRYR